MKNALKASTALERTFRTARADLNAIRDRIADLQAERAKVEFMPRDLSTIEKEVDQAIEAAIRDRPMFFPFLLRQEPYYLPIAGSFNKSFELNAFGVFAALDAPRLKAAIMATMPADGLTPESRSAQLARLDTEILSAEIAEEVACRELERALGTDMPRRADANPAVLLAPDVEIGLEVETVDEAR
ncbi:hypothetical protein NKH86_06865 [Mesorhizobium sp. M0913]|uniref:hypothetical protein n=1 Tax=Mesorhizobium sp. M0913 TaxID=2957026 RepID=UPI003337007E